MAKADTIIGVDEGGVLTGVPTDGEFKGPVQGEDRAGVFDPVPDDDGIVLKTSPSSAPDVQKTPRAKAKASAAAAASERLYVFTNTRYPEMKVAIVKEDDNGNVVQTGDYVEFHSTKLMTSDPVKAQQIRDLDRGYIFEEPAEYLTTDPNDEKMFVHRATGFRTLSKKAYQDWVDNSEWSAKPR